MVLTRLKLAWRYKYLLWTIPLNILARVLPIGAAFVQKLRGVAVGKDVHLSNSVFIDEMEPGLITIEDHVTIGPGAIIMAHNNYGIFLHPYLGPREIAPVKIGKGAFIGTGAIVLSGVTIGEGAVVGAGSVITKSVPPYTIVAGVPARKIKKLKKKFAERVSHREHFANSFR